MHRKGQDFKIHHHFYHRFTVLLVINKFKSEQYVGILGLVKIQARYLQNVDWGGTSQAPHDLYLYIEDVVRLEEEEGVVLPRPQSLPARGAGSAAVETRGQTRLTEHVAARRGEQSLPYDGEFMQIVSYYIILTQSKGCGSYNKIMFTVYVV